jgi:hypothetical protein
VAHADDGFLDAEDLVEPAQVDHPVLYVSVQL